MSGPPAEPYQPVAKTKIESYIQRVSSPKEEGKVSVVCTKPSSRVSPITSTVASKLEPSFNIYGYQGYQPMYLFPSQLKAREGLGSSVTERASVMPQLNYPADSRRNLSLTRSPSMSPKQQKVLQERISPKIQLPGESIKSHEYFQPTPAHQNSSSPSLPGRAGTPQYQEQPQNLVKSKQNRMTNVHPQQEPSPRNLTHSTTGVSRRYQPSPTPPKCSVTAYPSSLIQAGLVPNPMYSSSVAGTVSNSALKTGLYAHERSVPLVIDTSSNPSLVQNNVTCAQVSGITTGIPVCKPNTNSHALVYPHSLNSQWSQNSNIQQVSPPPQARMNSSSLSLFPPSSLNNLSHHNCYASPTLTPPAPSPATVSTPVRPNSSPSGPMVSSNFSLTDKKRKSPTENLATKRQKTENDSESPPQLHPNFPSDSRNDENPSPPALNIISRSPLTCEGLGVCVPQSGITLGPLVKNPQFKKENGFDVSDELNNLSTKKVQANESIFESQNSQCSSSKNTTNHPKLKKAWLQRHSENKDKMFPDEAESVVKNPGAAVLKLEDLDRTFHEMKESSFDKLSSGQDESSDENPKEVQTAVNGNQSSFQNQDKLDSVEDGECTKSTSDTEQELLKQKTRISQRQGSTSRFKTRGLKRKSFRQEKTEKDQLMLTNGSTLKKVKDEHQTQNKEAGNLHRKGRKPRGRGSAPENSQLKNNSNPVNIKEKTTVTILKKTGEPFFQNGPCGEVASKLPKCRECRMTPHQRSKKMPNNFCRFFAFRKLRYSKTGTLVSSGFSEPSDATEEDLRLWMPSPDNALDQLDKQTARLLLEYVGNQFYYLVKQEKEAQALHMNQDKTITWKRMVQNVREMCDICEATLFNIHWVCHKCGFVVCIDCYRARKDGSKKEDDFPHKDRDECQWLLCNNRQPHDQEKLMLTQIIPGTALWDMGNMLQATTFCSSGRKSNNGICKQLISAVNMHICDKEVAPVSHNSSSELTQFGRKNGLSDPVKGEELSGYTSDSEGSPLSWLADVALGKSSRPSPRTGTEAECETTNLEEGKEIVNGREERSVNRSTLRELLIRPNEKGVSGSSTEDNQEHLKENIVESVSQVTEPEVKKEQLQFSCSSLDVPKPQRSSSIQSRNLTESSLLHPDIPHSWLCSGKLLRLHDSQLHQNIQIFQEQWKRGQPVMVSNITSRLDTKLWNPESFGQEFGGVKTEFVDCNTGRILSNQSLRKFWDGFENVSKRLKSKNGEEMVLKLKDWPPGENFRENLPLRYKDLIKVLPLPEYTQPGGIFNLVDRLPDDFIQPDVGLKMCSAYGSTHYSTIGTSNLHLDVCDIVNIMMYTSNGEESTQDVLNAMEEGGCDEGTLCRVRDGDIKPGAIWHIYSDEEADKIRDFLNKVAKDQGEKVDSHHDPLLEQNWYLNGMLRKRLYAEYGVEGYTVVQCVGDAIFIPAGSPHQVQNIYSCITVVEDFISPESLARCFYLTQELRNSPEISTYQEDRLQIKNVIYHTVKDALSVLQAGEET
ncbi:lysine-specific demethylase 3A-like [Limulus polyphemus]|uniref:Lysine-specific demethylase 3A-like n=1 Tax=Limulus polyphemus TaxID=6850 RepID=A0ABM1TDP9_LIMPO|nr:lysine-specific demethylase 3A-like [Limulus polyphemus]